MMQNNISITTTKDIHTLKADWQRLDEHAAASMSNGKIQYMDYTFYQTYAWNSFLYETYNHLFIPIEYVVVSVLGEVKLILPLLIDRLNKRLRVLTGRISGICNVVCPYKDTMAKELIQATLSYLSDKYKGGWKYKFRDVPLRSLLVEVLKDRGLKGGEKCSFHILVEQFESYDAYLSSLGKNIYKNIRKAYNHLATDGKGNSLSTTDVAPETVEVGQTIVVRPGEKFPLDGMITSGSTTVNNMALTGESRPVSADVGSEVFSGCTNLSGVVSVKVTKPFSQSTAMRIIELVENAAERKAKSETFISRFARIYTPVVVVLAVAIAIVPPLLSGAFAESFATWLYRAMMFLVVSCPCALVISVPLTFFAGIGGASREGILIKGANFFDVLSNVGTVVFDKTGTLTRGQFAVEAVHGNTCDSGSEHTATAENHSNHDSATHLLHMAAHVEHHSSHPIAEALRQAFPQEGSDGCRVDDIEEIAGQGVCAVVEGRKVCIGNEKLMESIGAEWHDCTQSGTIVHVAIDGTYRGHIVVGDSIKPGSREAVEQLRSLGVASIIMLTGDNDAAARKVADELGISEWHAHLLPEAKLSRVDKLIATEPQGRRVAFVGDGINDAPVLRRADVGIAMGGMGSEAAIDAADVVVMDDNPEKVSAAIRRARSTQRIAWQNVVFAVGIKVVFLLLASLGMCTMWMAVFADVGVTVLAVLNAMRALK